MREDIPLLDEDDCWAKTDDVIPGEFQCEVAIGDYKTRDMVDLMVTLQARSPIQYARLALAFADAAQDQADIAVRN